MSRPIPPRLKHHAPAASSSSGLVTPVTTLDPVHRQKILQLRLQAANASRKRQGFRKENLHRHFFWLIRTLLWLSAIFSLTVLVIAFPLMVDPAMESLWRRFSSKALICLTNDIQIHHSRMPDGSVKHEDDCTWTSCRNGCTGELFRCVQLFANVSHLPWEMMNATNITTWTRPDDHQHSQQQQQKNNFFKAERASSTKWAVNWSAGRKLPDFNRSAFAGGNPLYQAQRDWSRRQFAKLIDELGGDSSSSTSLFAATDVRLMVNVRGCGYTVDCVEFNRTAGVVGSLLPCYLSSRGDYNVGVVDYHPELDRNIIFYLFTLPVVIFSSAVFLLICIAKRCCIRCCVKKKPANRPEFSAALLIINSGQVLGGKVNANKYWTAPQEDNDLHTELQPLQLSD